MVVKLDLLFRQLEVSVPCCAGEEDCMAALALLDEARGMIKTIASGEHDAEVFCTRG
jgi:hypothetical protein